MPIINGKQYALAFNKDGKSGCTHCAFFKYEEETGCIFTCETISKGCLAIRPAQDSMIAQYSAFLIEIK